MAQFTTRVELHGASPDDSAYQTLHSAMQRLGFERTIRDDSTGTVYWLPPAEYIIVVAHTERGRVCTLAGEAAAVTGYEYSVLVTGPSTCNWTNLKEKH